MPTIDEKIADYLTEELVSHGKVDGNSKYKVLEVKQAIIYGLERREGVAKAVENLANSYKRIDNITGYLYRIFNSLPIKPPPKTIEQELAEERQDLIEHKKLIDELNSLYDEGKVPYFTDRTPEDLLVNTSILDTDAYKGEREEYAVNTYKVVLLEAMKEKTSMHEICRRKGLIYDLLII